MAADVDGHGANVGVVIRRRSGLDDIEVEQFDIQDFDGVAAEDFTGAAFGRVPCGAGDMEDAPCGNGIKGETFAEVVGMVKSSVLDAGSNFEHPEKFLDQIN